MTVTGCGGLARACSKHVETQHEAPRGKLPSQSLPRRNFPWQRTSTRGREQTSSAAGAFFHCPAKWLAHFCVCGDRTKNTRFMTTVLQHPDENNSFHAEHHENPWSAPVGTARHGTTHTQHNGNRDKANDDTTQDGLRQQEEHTANTPTMRKRDRHGTKPTDQTGRDTDNATEQTNRWLTGLRTARRHGRGKRGDRERRQKEKKDLVVVATTNTTAALLLLLPPV